MDVNNKISKLLGAFIIILALTFSPNMYSLDRSGSSSGGSSYGGSSSGGSSYGGSSSGGSSYGGSSSGGSSYGGSSSGRSSYGGSSSGRSSSGGSSSGGSSSGGSSYGDSGDRVPLDGGLSILLLGAAAFGVRKLYDNK